LSSLTVYVGSADGNFYALNAANGNKRWVYPSGGGNKPFDNSGTVYFGTGSGDVYALGGGTLVWRHRNLLGVDGRVAYDSGLAWVGSYDGDLCGLDASNGAVQWEYPLAGAVTGGVFASNGVGYVGADSGYLFTMAANGSPGWYTKLGAPVEFATPNESGNLI
jgi:outer membrane protein assembly factor BamB